MELIDYMLRNIKLRIPKEILNLTFNNKSSFRHNNSTNLDWLIKRDVIDLIVLEDLNVVGGEHVYVDLGNISPRIVDGGYIYDIPLSSTGGRNITRVYSIESGGTSRNGASGILSETANRMLEAVDGLRSNGTSQIELVPPNSIYVKEMISSFSRLRCVLGYDERLSSVDQVYWREFANLAVLACEVYIYNNIDIPIGSGSRTGGSSNDRLRNRIDQMADSFETYDELLKGTISKLSIMSDTLASHELLVMQLPGGRR